MGRFDNSPSPKMMHFSHPHELELWSNQTLMPSNSTLTISCAACQLSSTEDMYYICRPCNFSLHSTCAQFPQAITHPAHKNHPLTLLPVAAYPGGIFNCDACNRRGNGFSYHCGSCEFDLHVLCASKPLKFIHQSHSCQLDLTFTNPYGNAKGFSCDVCRKFGSKQWLYRCSACEFDVHLDCITNPSTIPAPRAGGAPSYGAMVRFQGQDIPPTQHLEINRSYPIECIGNQVGLPQFSQPIADHSVHGASMGIPPMAHQPQLGPINVSLMDVGPVMYGPTITRPNVLMQTASTRQMGNVQPVDPVMHGPTIVRPNVLTLSPSASGISSSANRTSGLMNAVIQDIVEVEGGEQEVWQSFKQGAIGGGDGGIGGGGGGGGGEDGSSALSFGGSSDTQI